MTSAGRHARATTQSKPGLNVSGGQCCCQESYEVAERINPSNSAPEKFFDRVAISWMETALAYSIRIGKAVIIRHKNYSGGVYGLLGIPSRVSFWPRGILIRVKAGVRCRDPTFLDILNDPRRIPSSSFATNGRS